MCPNCNRPLIKIDPYGEMLEGCVHCNRWGHPGEEKLIMQLKDDDLAALKNDETPEDSDFDRTVALGYVIESLEELCGPHLWVLNEIAEAL
jgi:hypothetical protein